MPLVTNVVCHLDPKYGGMSSSVPALVGATVRTGRYEAELIGWVRPGEDFPGDSLSGCSLRILPHIDLRLFSDVSARRLLEPSIRICDILHVHGIWAPHCHAAFQLARRFGKPVVVSAHGMLERWAVRNRRWRKAFYSWLLERKNIGSAGCLRALTQAEVGDFRRYGVTNPAAVIPNGVTVPSRLDAALFLETFPALRGRRLVLFLSRIHYKKGLDLLSHAWAALAPRFPDAHLVLAGPDFEDSRAGVEKLLAGLGLARRVTFTGMLHQDLKWSAMAAANVFVLPSYSEGFSVAALEALGAGVPVVITDRCNFNEIAGHRCGWVVPPTTGDLDHALREALSMPESARSVLGANARRLATERYGWDSIGTQLADVYDWLLLGRPPSNVQLLFSRPMAV